MANKGRAQPRVVCCAIPIARASGKVLLVTSRKQPSSWVCESYPSYFLVFNPILTLYTVPKGGWEPSDRVLEAAASREALEEGPTLCSSFRLPPPDSLLPPSLLLLCPCCSSLFKQRVYAVLLRGLSPQYRQLQQRITFMSWTSRASIKTG